MHKFIILLTLLNLTAIESFASEEIIFSFRNSRNPEVSATAIARFSKYLSLELSRPVKALVPSNRQAATELLIDRKCDIAVLLPADFRLAKQNSDSTTKLALGMPTSDGSYTTHYSSVMLARKSSKFSGGIKQEDLGKIDLEYTRKNSLAGHLYPQRYLLSTYPSLNFKSLRFSSNGLDAIDDLLKKRADVIFISSKELESILLGDKKLHDRYKDLKSIQHIGDIPTEVIAIRSGIPEDEANRFSKAILQVSEKYPALTMEVFGEPKLMEITESTHFKNFPDMQ